MTRQAILATLGAVSLGLAACGGYDQEGYNESNAGYDEQGNAAYGEPANQSYDMPENNAAYAPPPAVNESSDNVVDVVPPDNVTNGY